METYAYQKTDLLRNNLCGQLVNNSLLHEVWQFVVATLSYSQQEKEMVMKKDTEEMFLHLLAGHVTTCVVWEIQMNLFFGL